MRDGTQVLANVLDDLSFRSSKATQLAALQHIHTILADVCVGQPAKPGPWSNQLHFFLSLQNDFETNIASRIISSGIVSASAALRAVEEIRAKGSSNRPASTVADVTALALSALQGMALIHPRSKAYMGRKLSIQTFLDLLTALRHASANPDDPDATVLPGVNTTDATLAASLSPLACSVIDTLLCLLVDSPAALRVFEECNGLEVIVRTLKKVTGQQVRMKCLEFLYFYLQDEEVLAITGAPTANIPLSSSKSSTPASASKTASTPAKPRVPQTPRRPRTNQTPAKDRPRATPLSRTVSGDSTFSNSDLASTRSVSRASNASHSSVSSAATNSTTATDSTTNSNAIEPERRFSRTMVMPSLSYSSSTISSTSTNQTLDPHGPSPQQSRPPTPRRKPSVSLSEECYVPLPESPSKPRPLDVGIDETPRRRQDDTPRAKSRHRSESSTGALPAPPLPKLNLFPTPALAGPFGEKVPGSSPRTATSVGLSLLTGEIDYTPTSPKKTKPSKRDDIFAPQAEPKPAHEAAPRTPKPVQDLGVKPRHRPCASEILPRPTVAKPGPRNVSTPTTPTTPIDPKAPTPATTTPLATTPSGPENAPCTPPAPHVPATPARVKRAVIPGGIRTPGRPGAGVGEDLRKSLGVEGLRKSQSVAEGLRKSQVGAGASKRSHPSSEALRKSQASSEALRKSQVKVDDKDQIGQAHRLKKSTSSVSVVARTSTEENRKVAGEGAKRAKELSSKENVEAEPRRSVEMEKPASSEAGRDVLPAGGKLVRTSAEKKELLSAWLGNVDALVEGVQRAGVWGLR